MVLKRTTGEAQESDANSFNDSPGQRLAVAIESHDMMFDDGGMNDFRSIPTAANVQPYRPKGD